MPSKKKTAPKKAYIAIDTSEDYVIGVGTIEFILGEIQTWVDDNSTFESVEDVTDIIKIYELGEERPLFVYSKLEITVG